MKFSQEIEKLKKILEEDKKSGKYRTNQNVGKNVLIGILVILAGIFYSIGGLELIIKVSILCVVILIVLSIILYGWALWSLHFDKK